MYFLRVACITATIFASSFSRANESLEPVVRMFMNGMERHEFAMVSNAAIRCGSLYMLLSGILTRDTNDKDEAAKLNEQGLLYGQVGIYTVAALRTHRGVDADISEIQDRVVQQMGQVTEFYVARMTSNQASAGEMWGSDDLIKGDMKFCSKLGVLVSEEWGKTLESNNWDYWDEAFKGE